MPPTLLGRMLAAATDPQARLDPVILDDVAVEWAIRNGLGPLVCRLVGEDRLDPGTRTHARLLGAALTSKAIAHRSKLHTADLLDTLEGAGLGPAIIKGVAIRACYYPEPHLRSMRDVDLLLPDGEVPAAARLLHERGFVQGAPEIEGHHHAPPLRHPETGLWVELHHAVRPPSSPSASEAPLDPETVRSQLRRVRVWDRAMMVLSPECELALLAVGWCDDLRHRAAYEGTQRALIDTVYLLRRTGPEFDWDSVTAWAQGSYVGSCLAVLTTYLDRHGAFPGPDDVPPRLISAQSYLSRTTLAMVQRALDRFFGGPTRTRRLATATNVTAAMGALMAPRGPLRNLAALPVSLAFPPAAEGRFDPRRVLRRLRSLVSAD